MRTENEFNAKFGKSLRTLEPYGVMSLKVAEKYHIGVCDFFIWHGGRCAAVESKFVRELPKRNGKVLGHAFDGPQITFLKRIASAGSPAWGLIAIHEEKKIVLVPVHDIPPEGNWQGTIPPTFRSYDYDQTYIIVQDIFGLRENQNG